MSLAAISVVDVVDVFVVVVLVTTVVVVFVLVVLNVVVVVVEVVVVHSEQPWQNQFLQAASTVMVSHAALTHVASVVVKVVEDVLVVVDVFVVDVVSVDDVVIKGHCEHVSQNQLSHARSHPPEIASHTLEKHEGCCAGTIGTVAK